MSNHIVDFISAAVQDKPAAAANAFRNEIEDRIDAKLADFQETIRQNMFASEAVLEEQLKVSGYYAKGKEPVNSKKLNQNTPLEILVHGYIDAHNEMEQSERGSTEYDSADSDLQYIDGLLRKKRINWKEVEKLAKQVKKTGKYPIIKEEFEGESE